MATLAELYEARYGEATALGAAREASGELARMLSHRSFRRWKPERVSEDLLDLLLAAALSTPTKSDLMQIAVINVTEQENKNRIAELIPSMPWIANAPVFLLFCGDGRRIRQICELRGKDFAHEPLDAFFNATVDSALTLQAFIRAAEAEGLGCCPISAVREPVEEIAALTGLPDGVFPVAGLCVGWPEGEPWVSLRLPPRMLVHRDRYGDGDLAAEIEAYDRRRAECNPMKRQRDTDLHGEAKFYGWSEDKARQVAQCERRSFAGFVRRSFGF